ncbi:hypothetical protein N7530_002362 [Penicillium desertorum]|uniref:Uncharacterized protein n=1 Tax=Penicillium desertorum TaxID=1303715 RepID=A0A9W9WDM6_9EURO|nr:hypothetical protein N7530_012791 [Penicillium desertorum]KAJ5483116.1 hypothetical protein N7530_002362 [Penicillium desertorum]
MSDLENSSSPQEVEWQVAWFALLALGLAAMLQPCGNVLCQKANNHRFYIRASPVVCIVDVAQFIAFILLGFSCNPQAWLQNIKFELRQRFEGEDGAKDREKAENSIIVRWILMILGASLFNAIKLMMMQGIPWTQAWAMMFAISIVFAEVLILLVRFLSLDGSSAHTTPPAWRSYKISNVLDHIGIIPISLQFAVSYWTFFSFVLDPEGLPKHGPAGVAVGVTFGIIFLIPTGLEIIKGRIPGEFKGYQLYSLGCFAVISSLLSIPYVLDISSSFMEIF